ncbi:transposon ty3-I gag-pol polyprotein [Tanacetum coccineum]
MSATEAEYLATSEAAMESVWIRKFISRLGIVPTINKPIKMFCYNSAALLIANKPGVQIGARHYHRRYHYVRECIALGEIRFLKVHTDDNLADPFTKALPKGKLTQHARSMGLRLASSFIWYQSLLVSWMVTDLEDSKTYTVGGIWSGEYMDHGFTKSMSELDKCYTMLQELRSVIVGGALIHKNHEGSKHEGRRIRPTIGDFGGNCASNQSPFNNVKIKEWKEKKKEDRVPTTKIFHSKILINNSVCSLVIDGCSIHNLVLRKLVDFLNLPMEICPIEGYQVCRVPVTIGKSYKVEVLCIVDDIDECHILLGKPWRYEVNGKYDVKRNLYIFSWEGRRIAMVPRKVTPQLPKPEVKVKEKIVMVSPKVTPQLPKPEVKVEEKLVKAKVVDKHIEKIQDFQNKQHDDKISTLLFETTNKVGTLKTCEEIISFNDDEDVKGFNCFQVDVKRKSIEDKVRREKVFEVDEAFNIENSRASSFQVRGVMLTKPRSMRFGIGLHLRYCLSCENLVSKALVKAFKLPTEPHPSPYQIGWIKKGLALKVIEICKVPLAMGKHYNELVTCDVVNMETCHDFQAERKETGVFYALVMKCDNDVMENAIPVLIKPLLAEFGKIVTDDTPNTLPPLRNIQHQIDLSRKTTLLVSISSEVLGFDSIKELYVIDEDFGNIWMELETKQHQGEFLLLDGYLFKGNRLCIPKTSLESQLVKETRAKGLSALGQDKIITSVENCDDGSRPEEQHLVVPCFNKEIVKFPTQAATTEISGDNGSNLEDFLILLTREEADIIGPIMAVEDEPLTMLGSGPNIIKKDFSNDLDGQHSTDESKPYHNTLRWNIMRLKWGYVISIGQICTNVWLKQEMVCAQRRTWDPGITWLKILKEHLEDKINDNAYVVDLPNTMSISKMFNLLDIYEFHSEDMNEGKHLRTSSFKERGNDGDMIQELAEEYMVSKNKFVSWIVTDLEDSKTHTVGGIWFGEYMDHGFIKSMSELDKCYTMLQELRSVIVGGALIHKNHEGSKHEGRRIRPTIGNFDNLDGCQRELLIPSVSCGGNDENFEVYLVRHLEICIGAAHGLTCLHNATETQQRVLDRDIKSSNILLDENWNAKISDFGLSKFGPANQQTSFLVSHAVGTLGYCDPLYAETRFLTKESDVYVGYW